MHQHGYICSSVSWLKICLFYIVLFDYLFLAKNNKQYELKESGAPKYQVDSDSGFCACCDSFRGLWIIIIESIMCNQYWNNKTMVESFRLNLRDRSAAWVVSSIQPKPNGIWVRAIIFSARVGLSWFFSWDSIWVRLDLEFSQLHLIRTRFNIFIISILHYFIL